MPERRRGSHVATSRVVVGLTSIERRSTEGSRAERGSDADQNDNAGCFRNRRRSNLHGWERSVNTGRAVLSAARTAADGSGIEDFGGTVVFVHNPHATLTEVREQARERERPPRAIGFTALFASQKDHPAIAGVHVPDKDVGVEVGLHRGTILCIFRDGTSCPDGT